MTTNRKHDIFCIDNLMENNKKLTVKYILSCLYRKEVFYFTTKLFRDLFAISDERVYQIIFSLKKKGLIREVENGKYLVLGFEPHRVLSNPFFIASRLVSPAYVSFRSALNYFGLTEQVPFTVYVATTKQKKEIEFENYRYKYVKVALHKFFGYEKQMIGEQPVLIAEKEKAIVDSLDQLSYGGGFLEVAKALFNAKDEIDNQKLIEYALKIKNKALVSRLGYLLDKYQIKTEGLSGYLSPSLVPLDPDRPKGKQWDRKWRLNVNIDSEKLFAWRKT